MGVEHKRNQGDSTGWKIIIQRYALFIVGIFVLAFGAATMIQANLGVASWDVLHIGMTNWTPLSIGTWVQIVGLLMIGGACWLDRTWPQLGSIVNIVLVGFFLNWILGLHLIPSVQWVWERGILLVAGILCMGFGSGMYVASNVGAGPRDGLTLVLARKLGLSIRLVRTLLEVAALTIGWIAGGPVAAGTFVSVFLIGPVMQASLGFWRRRLHHHPEGVSLSAISHKQTG